MSKEIDFSISRRACEGLTTTITQCKDNRNLHKKQIYKNEIKGTDKKSIILMRDFSSLGLLTFDLCS